MSSEAVERLVAAAGIERVVVVDDTYAATLEDFTGMLAGFDPAQRAEVTGLEAADLTEEGIWQPRIAEVWDQSDRAAQVAMIDNAYSIDQELERLASGAVETLRRLLPGIEPEGLALSDWAEKRCDVINAMEKTPTLVLFDQDFSHEEGGTATTGQRLLSEFEQALASRTVADDAYYGILTNTVQPDNEHLKRLEILRDAQVDPARFVLISKQHLQGDPASFAARLRTTLLAPVMTQLMTAVSGAIADVQNDAVERAKRIAPEDMEQMVIRGSATEGVWEPDALVRIFEIMQREKARADLRGATRVVKLTERLRTLADIDPLAGAGKTKATTQPAPVAIELQHEEIYETAEHINTLHLPLELGDLFAKDGSDKRFVLIAQPCDLSVRRGGERTPDLTHFLLAEVSTKQGHKGLFKAFELPYFNEESGESAFVMLARPVYTRALVLDSCVLNADGKARLDISADSPTSLLPHWLDKHTQMKRQGGAILGHVEGRSDVTKEHRKALTGHVTRDPFTPVGVGDHDGVIEWNCRRVGRVCDPYARALLSRFSQYFARDAYLQDLARI